MPSPKSAKEALGTLKYLDYLDSIQPLRVSYEGQKFIEHFGIVDDDTFEIAVITAKALIQQNEIAQAVAVLSRISDALLHLRITDSIASNLQRLAHYYTVIGQHTEAVRTAQRIIDADVTPTRRARAYCTLAIVHYDNGDTAAAHEALRRAKEIAATVSDDDLGTPISLVVLSTEREMDGDDLLDNMFHALDPGWRLRRRLH